MNVEAFLRFWSHYNTTIIEVLIGLILLTVVYLAFRSFFGPDESEAEASSGMNETKVADLEKTLQKILEKQAPLMGVAEAAGVEKAPGEAPGGGAVSEQQLTELKAQLEERERELSAVREEAEKLKAEGTGGLSGDEKTSYEAKLRDLQARLAEYEIISEDIADLSFYKEENAKLQAELKALKEQQGSGGASAATAEPTPAPEPVLAEESPVEEPTPVEAPVPAEEPSAEIAASEEPLAEPPPEMAPVEEAPMEAPAPTETAATEEAPAAKSDDAALMEQFEDFVKKG